MFEIRTKINEFDALQSNTAQKMKFSIKDFFTFTVDLVTFTEKILNGKLHLLCSVKRTNSHYHYRVNELILQKLFGKFSNQNRDSEFDSVFIVFPHLKDFQDI